MNHFLVKLVLFIKITIFINYLKNIMKKIILRKYKIKKKNEIE